MAAGRKTEGYNSEQGNCFQSKEEFRSPASGLMVVELTEAGYGSKDMEKGGTNKGG